jgi:cation-dependent mannose-6-phosphate receptor
MKLFLASAAALSLLSTALATATAAAAASDADTKKPKQPVPKPCTIRSESTGAFFDLTSLNVTRPAKDSGGSGSGSSSSKSSLSSSAAGKDAATVESWHSRGYDYPANFTLNICGPVVEELGHVEGLSADAAKNVSAFYTSPAGKTYSMGQANSELVIRGKTLVLNYTGGSYCDEGRKKRKQTIISLLCDREPLAPKSPKLTLSFIGPSEDECTYVFQARTQAACSTIENTPQQLGPGGVFSVIFLITAMVYFVGGCVYQRTVMHQRGWRQLPNYSMWSGIFGFFKVC